MDRRSYTRLLAVQAFYLLSFSDDGSASSVILSSIVALQKNHNNKDTEAGLVIETNLPAKARYDEELFTFLLNKFRGEKMIIDSLIIKFINKNWTLQRMDLILLSIIRAAACELLYLLDIPTNIIIDEYVNLSSSVLKIEETNFVNAISCSIAKHVRKEYGVLTNTKEDLLLTTAPS